MSDLNKATSKKELVQWEQQLHLDMVIAEMNSKEAGELLEYISDYVIKHYNVIDYSWHTEGSAK